MRKIAFAFITVLITTSTFSQNHNIDSLKKLLQTPKDDTLTARRYIEAATTIHRDYGYAGFEYATKGYELSRKLKWKQGQAESLALRGDFLRVTGSESEGLRDLLESIHLFEELKDSIRVVFSLNSLGLLYLTVEEYQRSIHYLSRAHAISKVQDNQGWIFATANNIGDLYIKMANTDSSLYYYNLSYQIANTSKNESMLAWSLRGLGSTHFQLKNYDLALTYLHKSLIYGQSTRDNIVLAFTNHTLAQVNLENGNRDSSIHYSRSTVEYARKFKHLPTILDAYKLMATAFKGIRADSTSKYFELAYNLRDSIYTAKKRNDITNMSYNEEERQKEVLTRLEKEKQERKRNIQFASIGIGLLSFIILSLLLSRSIIVKSGLVRFLGVVTLLLVFEFINLLIHPFLSDVTHHSPILMFLIMVSIAAMLVPAHHKLEHWITNQLVEKNRRIRLAAAKKTIASLEGQQQSAK